MTSYIWQIKGKKLLVPDLTATNISWLPLLVFTDILWLKLGDSYTALTFRMVSSKSSIIVLVLVSAYGLANYFFSSNSPSGGYRSGNLLASLTILSILSSYYLRISKSSKKYCRNPVFVKLLKLLKLVFLNSCNADFLLEKEDEFLECAGLHGLRTFDPNPLGRLLVWVSKPGSWMSSDFCLPKWSVLTTGGGWSPTSSPNSSKSMLIVCFSTILINLRF